MTQLSTFAAKNICHIKTADENGRSLHVFVMSNAVKKPQLEKAIKENKTPIDYAEYGEVLATCYGRYPTSSVRQLMKEKYGIDV